MPRKFKFTKKTIAALKPEGGKAYLAWDTTQPGLGVRVPASGRTPAYIFQRDRHGRTVRITLGKVDVWSPEDARSEVRKLTLDMDRGIDVRAERRKAARQEETLDDCIQLHQDVMTRNGRTPASIAMVRKELELHCKNWLKRPIRELTGEMIGSRHARLSRSSGLHLADRWARHIRAVWNTARAGGVNLGGDVNPVNKVYVAFNNPPRRREPISWDDLPGWWKTVGEIESPLHRSFFRLALFVGWRKTEILSLRWENVDLESGVARIVKPKGGERRAFSAPLSKPAWEILEERREGNAGADGGWVFPSERIVNGKRQLHHLVTYKLHKVELPSAHRLRDTFATAAFAGCALPLERVKLLMNHSLPKTDVTLGYVRPDPEDLRPDVEAVADFLLAKIHDQQGTTS